MAWFKVFHLVGIILWIGALMDLTRMLGYHVKKPRIAWPAISEIERRIFFGASVAGLTLTLAMGVCLLIYGGGPAYYFSQPYFHAKLTGVAALIAIQFLTFRAIRRVARAPEAETVAAWPFKLLHGLAGLFLLLILIMIFTKPWQG